MDIELFRAVIFNQDIWSEIKKHMFPRRTPRANGKLTNGENMFDYGTSLDHLRGIYIINSHISETYFKYKDRRLNDLFPYEKKHKGYFLYNNYITKRFPKEMTIYPMLKGFFTCEPATPGDFVVLNEQISLLRERSKPLMRDGKLVQPFTFTIISLLYAARQGNLTLIEYVSKYIHCTREVLYNAISSGNVEAVKLVLSKKFYKMTGEPETSKILKIHMRAAVDSCNTDVLDFLATKSKLTTELEHAIISNNPVMSLYLAKEYNLMVSKLHLLSECPSVFPDLVKLNRKFLCDELLCLYMLEDHPDLVRDILQDYEGNLARSAETCINHLAITVISIMLERGTTLKESLRCSTKEANRLLKEYGSIFLN